MLHRGVGAQLNQDKFLLAALELAGVARAKLRQSCRVEDLLTDGCRGCRGGGHAGDHDLDREADVECRVVVDVDVEVDVAHGEDAG